MPMKKAIVALAHRLLVIIIQILATAEEYQDRRPIYYDERDRLQIVHHTMRRLEKLGYHVRVEPANPGRPVSPPDLPAIG